MFNTPIARKSYCGGERVDETFPSTRLLVTNAGHSDYQAMKPYIEIAKKTKVDAMKLFDEEMKK